MTLLRNGSEPLLALGAVPAPWPLPDGYDRHDPDVGSQRAALQSVVDRADWVALDWPELIEHLLAVGRTDVVLSRLGEGHVDALRILDQAGAEPLAGALYGVWASRSQRTGLVAEPYADGLRLTGTLRFASGAGLLDRALVPVWPDADHHLLIDLDVTGLPVDTTVWHTDAMAASRSHQITLDGLELPSPRVIGTTDFYLSRPGFFPGGVGVAACWAGGAARVLDLLQDRNPTPDDVRRSRLGHARTDLAAAITAVRAAAAVLTGTPDHQAVSTEARAVVAAAVRRLLAQARAVAGAAGLAMDAELAHAVPDLELYTAQQNADADALWLGLPPVRR